ncbi:MAG TPA: uroporphyrinogen-III synthase [Alphaproteobacteria bacterium]
MTRIIVTRSDPGGENFAERLRHQKYDAVSMPILQAEATLNPPPMSLSQMDGYIVTSVHALDFADVPDALKKKPLFTVGAATANHAMAMGWTNIKPGPGDVQQLADSLPDKKLLHICGEDVVPGTREALKTPYWTVYRTVPTGVHNGLLEDIFKTAGRAIITLHSPRAAAILQPHVQTYQTRMQDGHIIFLCLSMPVLKSLGLKPDSTGLYAAAVPTEDAMVEALAGLIS